MNWSKNIDQFLQIGLIAGLLMMLGGVIFFNRMDLYSFVQKHRDYIPFFEDDAEDASEDGWSILRENQTDFAESNQLGLNLDHMVLACKVYNLLSDKYYKGYPASWSESVETWAPKEYGFRPDRRVRLPKGFTPEAYWITHRGTLAKVLRKWDIAFRFGGTTYKYAEQRAHAALGLCKPQVALQTWAEYIGRVETEVEQEFTKNLAEASKDESDDLDEDMTYIGMLGENKFYRTALENYTNYLNLYDRSVMAFRVSQIRSQAVLKKSDLPHLDETAPMESLRILQRQLELTTTPEDQRRLQCRIGKVYVTLSEKVSDTEILYNQDAANYSTKAVRAFRFCLQIRDPLLQFEATLALAELFLAQKNSQNARQYLANADQSYANLTSANKNKSNLNSVTLQEPWILYYYRNRLDRVRFSVSGLN